MKMGLLKHKDHDARATGACVTCDTSRIRYSDVVLQKPTNADEQLTVIHHTLGNNSSVLVPVNAEEQLTTPKLPHVARLGSLCERLMT